MAIPNLQDKQVLVTGAGSGIGRATVLEFARQGANVVAVDIHLAPLETLQREVETFGVRCQIYTVDVSSEVAMQDLADRIHATQGALDVLVNNAGIVYLGQFFDSNLAHWSRIINVNLMGVVHGCRFFIPKMIEAGGARHVVNVASSAANYPAPSMAAYAASKYAVAGFTEVLKMELSNSNVGITTVYPGVINTAITSTGAGVAPAMAGAQIAKLQQHYKTKGSSPDVVAKDMVRAVRKGHDMCFSGSGAALVYHVKRISVKLLRATVVRESRKMGYLPD